jgi:hypothetical protein
MAEMIIMLRRDPRSGKQNIIVKLDSDPDALPIEHEQLHRKLVEKLVGKGLDPEDMGELIIEREPEAQPNQPVGTPGEAQKRAQTNTSYRSHTTYTPRLESAANHHRP